MRINLKSLCAGPAGVFQPGWRDVPDELGRSLIAGGAAEAEAAIAPPAEVAQVAPAETAKSPKRSNRGRQCTTH